MSDTRAEAFRASVAPDEIRLDFGAAGPRTSPVEEPTIALTRRIVLQARTALRLRSRLREALREAETRAATAPATAAAAMSTTPVNAAPDLSGERAARLYRLVDDLGAAALHERSFRMTDEALIANRMLLSVGRERLGAAAADRVASLCAELGMPRPVRDQVPGLTATARCVHFGFEGEHNGGLYKVYFERQDALANAAKSSGGAPVLLHVAYKWDCADPARHVVTHYHWLPRLPEAEMRERMTRTFADGKDTALASAHAILQLACARAGAERLQYLDVSEPGSARRSFDVNLYDAGMTLRDVQAPLVRLRDHFRIRPGHFQALLDQIAGKRLGHIAGGVHRDGRAFVTVYYGGSGTA